MNPLRLFWPLAFCGVVGIYTYFGIAAVGACFDWWPSPKIDDGWIALGMIGAALFGCEGLAKELSELIER